MTPLTPVPIKVTHEMFKYEQWMCVDALDFLANFSDSCWVCVLSRGDGEYNITYPSSEGRHGMSMIGTKEFLIEKIIELCYPGPPVYDESKPGTSIQAHMLYEFGLFIYGHPPCFVSEPIRGLKEALEQKGIKGVQILTASDVVQMINSSKM